MYVFIDEIITITIDDPFWLDHTKKAALFVIHPIFIPLHSDQTSETR